MKEKKKIYQIVFEPIGEKQEKITNESDDDLEEEDEYVQYDFYGY